MGRLPKDSCPVFLLQQCLLSLFEAQPPPENDSFLQFRNLLIQVI